MNKVELYRQVPAIAESSWRKSSLSGVFEDNCVQVTAIDGGVALRDSKDHSREAHAFTVPEFAAFIASAKAGEFDDLI